MKMFNIFRKKTISKEEARQEIEELRRIYRSKFPMSRCGFMVGSCLGRTKHKYGDSGRYEELIKIINKEEK